MPAPLIEAAIVLAAARPLYAELVEQGLHVPQAGSAAEANFSANEEGPGGPWPDGINEAPRMLAANLIRNEADACVAAARLIETGEVWDPLHAVVRQGFEFAVRATWLLDPNVSHRVRCARWAVFEMVSGNMVRRVAGKMPDTPDRRKSRNNLRAGDKKFHSGASELFNGVVNTDPSGDPLKWTIEGVEFGSWEKIANGWSNAEKSEVSGGGMYDFMSLLAHPQGLKGSMGFQRDPDDSSRMTRVIPDEHVMKLARLSAQMFYSGVTMLGNYHGFKSPLISQWEEHLAKVFPGFFC